MLINYELLSALAAMSIAQLFKLILDYLLNEKLNFGMLISTGGMPSSHVALTSALTTALAIGYGLGSPYFSISLILTLIVAQDAAGVRWQAGKHASEINKLKQDLHNLVQAISEHKSPSINRKELKELLGHKPLEVFLGGILGFVTAYLFQFLYNLG